MRHNDPSFRSQNKFSMSFDFFLILPVYLFLETIYKKAMAYNEQLAERIRKRLGETPNVTEKQMMGGLTFMVNDKMCIGIIKDELMCRIDPGFHDKALDRKGCRTMDFTNRPMNGYVMINDLGMETDEDFDYWINLSLDFNKQAKQSKKKKKKD